MDMELDLFTNFIVEENPHNHALDVDGDGDIDGDAEGDGDGDADGERCGICMDIVVDRGLLDSCQHWFCFLCIDNWATITNLCPLCQIEFQLITCIPVFDTIATKRPDDYDDDGDDSHSRDDDWPAQDEDNTVSFPDYYIDENAVACLGGGSCIIRNGSLTPEQASILDTSIACDSCDIWYHASCVGFDPEGSEIDTWLCPRCLLNLEEQKSESSEMFNSNGQLSLPMGDHHSLAHTYSGKVSISVADDGETALVVSRIAGEEMAREPITNCISSQKALNHRGTEKSLWIPDSGSSELNKLLDQGNKAMLPQPTIVSVKLEEHDAQCGQNEGESNKLPFNSSERNPSVDENLADRKTSAAPKAVKKRKYAEKSLSIKPENGNPDAELVDGPSTRKLKARKANPRTLNDQTGVHTTKVVEKITKGSKGPIDNKRGIKKSPTVDIMSIVKGTESRIAGGAKNQKEAGKDAKVQKNAAGLRVKKIMRRPDDSKESAEVVLKLKKEIREAVQKSSDSGKSIVDPNLLAAFRAAVAEPSQNPSPVSVKAKKLMLQKGKARDNLTKKIYTMSNGKRRRAWDRDCEVEFWKHRCIRTSKPEKIATLKSVLNLLQRNPETRIVNQNLKEEDRAPILSRLYLADASVFPRKDDIKPLSVLKASTSSHNGGLLSGVEKDGPKFQNTNETPAETSTAADDKNKKGSAHIKTGIAARKVNTGGQSEKCSSEKKITGKTEGVPVDKRKWALEILARKTASNSTSPNSQKQDDAVLKGNYPLLAELPTDLRPKLAPTRQNKIPSSVRLAQLHRFTEHFLKLANLPAIRRTAATELAVADAVNIEKQLADRSNSKAVYLNLCSQEIRRHTNSCTPAECTPPMPSPGPAEAEQSSTLPILPETEAALRAAGLLSDSPPSSPVQNSKDLNCDSSPVADVKEEEEETENIFEMDSQPDVDIYGDFEYDLDEEDYIGVTTIANPKQQAEEVESKVKVVFSTLSSSKSEIASEVKDQNMPSSSSVLGFPNDADRDKKDCVPLSKDTPRNGEGEEQVKVDFSSSSSSKSEIASEGKDQNMPSSSSVLGFPNDADRDKKDSVPLPGDALINGEGEELSLAECEQLYGPEKEPLAREFPTLFTAENLASQSVDKLDAKIPDMNNHSVVAEGQSPVPTQAVDNTQEEKNNDIKGDKKSQSDSVLKKVEAYIKEHIRPLCKSGVITVDQYRWAVGKTTDKVMKYHTKAKNAKFLIKDGDKVKKLAEQYIEAASKHKETK